MEFILNGSEKDYEIINSGTSLVTVHVSLSIHQKQYSAIM